MTYALWTGFFVSLPAIVNPFGNLPIFVSYTQQDAPRVRQFRPTESGIRASERRVQVKLRAKMDDTEARLQVLVDRAKERSAAMKRETDAKVEALEAQAKKASEDTRKKFQERVSDLKAKCTTGMEKLKRSWERAKEPVEA